MPDSTYCNRRFNVILRKNLTTVIYVIIIFRRNIPGIKNFTQLTNKR